MRKHKRVHVHVHVKSLSMGGFIIDCYGVMGIVQK